MNTDALQGFLTFRELDAAMAHGKGSAFRAFKRLAPPLREGEDFLRLTPADSADAIEALRRQARIYPASINVVLLHPGAADRVRAGMQAHG
ncbi:hypothetical protein [Natronospira bacteriovora]|uniref:Uncharacterized protein n=1 Tax=Natronospira bacteriovora TaxID=3069753 RepID=A0ABU0WA04_9GAMM|nr:hypothetical protein [Natronospira sp. AB-CW4]MDQ2070871.1 hypothetical protein [Natronospira sp. AB-CW4]